MSLLPPGDHRILHKPALSLVVCQVRFEESVGLEGSAVGRRLYEQLGGRGGEFPQLAQFRTQQITLTPQAAPDAVMNRESQRGWRIATETDETRYLFTSGSLALETTQFKGWPTFGPQLERGLEILGAEVSPAVEERIGLRFINTIDRDVIGDDSWSDFITSETLGIAEHRSLGSLIQSMETRAVLQLEDKRQCVVRVARDDEGLSGGLVVDIDAFVSRGIPFVVPDVMATCTQLNEDCVAIFQQIAKPELLTKLGQEQ